MKSESELIGKLFELNNQEHRTPELRARIDLLQWILQPRPSVELECPKCEHVWPYKGESLHYVTCPHCMRKVKLMDSINGHK